MKAAQVKERSEKGQNRILNHASGGVKGPKDDVLNANKRRYSVIFVFQRGAMLCLRGGVGHIRIIDEFAAPNITAKRQKICPKICVTKGAIIWER